MATYKCGNCGRILGDADAYITHYRGCFPKPEAAPEPLIRPIVPWELNHNDKKFLRSCRITPE